MGTLVTFYRRLLTLYPRSAVSGYNIRLQPDHRYYGEANIRTAYATLS